MEKWKKKMEKGAQDGVRNPKRVLVFLCMMLDVGSSSLMKS